jgi:hypothetical protein
VFDLLNVLDIWDGRKKEKTRLMNVRETGEKRKSGDRRGNEEWKKGGGRRVETGGRRMIS